MESIQHNLDQLRMIKEQKLSLVEDQYMIKVMRQNVQKDFLESQEELKKNVDLCFEIKDNIEKYDSIIERKENFRLFLIEKSKEKEEQTDKLDMEKDNGKIIEKNEVKNIENEEEKLIEKKENEKEKLIEKNENEKEKLIEKKENEEEKLIEKNENEEEKLIEKNENGEEKLIEKNKNENEKLIEKNENEEEKLIEKNENGEENLIEKNENENEKLIEKNENEKEKLIEKKENEKEEYNKDKEISIEELEDELTHLKIERNKILEKFHYYFEKNKNIREKVNLLEEKIKKIMDYEVRLEERLRFIDYGIFELEDSIRRDQIQYYDSIKNTLHFESCKYKDIQTKFNNVIEENSCRICLMPFNDEDNVSIFSCNKHYYHEQCLKDWMKYLIICPICREIYSNKNEIN